MTKDMRMKDIHEADRPRERLAAAGARTLATSELLAVLLGSGSRGESALGLATRLLASSHGWPRLAGHTYHELCATPGIGPATAARLCAAVELGRRATAPSEERPLVRGSAEAADLMRPHLSGLPEEEVWALLLDARHRPIHAARAAQGGVRSAVVHPASILRPALVARAAAIILAHNHPSGDPTPSGDDVAMTRRLVAAGKAVGVEVLDHLVFGAESYVSLRERGLGFDSTGTLDDRR